jgi:hypothetical protein
MPWSSEVPLVEAPDAKKIVGSQVFPELSDGSPVRFSVPFTVASLPLAGHPERGGGLDLILEQLPSYKLAKLWNNSAFC